MIGADGQPKKLTPQEFERFKEKFPNVANCILNPELIVENEELV